MGFSTPRWALSVRRTCCMYWLAWIVASISSGGKKKNLTYLWCIALVLWNTALVSPHWNHMVHKGNTDPLLFLYKKLHHRSNDNYLCACEGHAAQGRQDEDLTEGFWQMGDFVLISYQTVSQARSLIRSAVFVWSRPECCLVHAATQSYRICRQNPFFSHYNSVQKAFLSSLLGILDSTSLEMSQSDDGNCSQAGAFSSCW